MNMSGNIHIQIMREDQSTINGDLLFQDMNNALIGIWFMQFEHFFESQNYIRIKDKIVYMKTGLS